MKIKIDRGFLILIGATLIAGAAVAWRSGTLYMLETAAGAFGFLVVLLPKIIAGVFLAATIPVLIPRERVAAWIGRESGIRGLMAATLAGALLPGGPSMAYPMTASLMVSGADIGASLAFVTGWSLFNLNRTLIWELSFLPPEFVGIRVLASLLLPLAVGGVARMIWTRA